MRKYVLLLAMAAMLALPGAVFAQGNYISVLPGGVAYPAPSLVINYDANAGGPIVVDLYLDLPSVAGIGYFLSVDAGAGGGASSGDALWTMAGFAPPVLPFGWLPLGAAYYGGAGIGTTLAANNADPITGAPGAAALFNAYAPPPGNYAPNALGTATLMPAVSMVPFIGQTMLIEADQDMAWPATGATIDGAPPSMSSVDVLVNITPEPATALLLLGALPFMRRRR